VHPNLVATLLRFASTPTAREEDPITETLAWLLDRERVFLAAFLTVVAARCSVLRPLAENVEGIAIATQVVVTRVGGGVSRYDLVLDLDAPRMRVVVEVKVRASLTSSAIGDDGARTQIDDYLALAERAPGVNVVLTLGGDSLVAGAARSHPCFGGHVFWQEVHDALARVLRRDRRERTLDPAARLIAEQFVATMEARSMATPRLSFDGLLSVRRFMQFRAAYEEIITSAWSALHEDGTLAGFVKISKAAWQDEHQRLGYRLWTSRSDTKNVAFIGISYADDSIIDDVPDLIFFMEVAPRTPAAAAFTAHAPAITTAVEKLAARDPRARWQYVPSGWPKVIAARSLADVVADPDPRSRTHEFLRAAVSAARDEGLVKLYLDAVASNASA
jgi:hypothetical protein